MAQREVITLNEATSRLQAPQAGDTHVMKSLLEFAGVDHAGLKLLSLTTPQITALTPVAGMVVYDNTARQVKIYQETAWVTLFTDDPAEISAIAEKVTPVAADKILIEDSAAANVKKMVQIGNLPGGGGGAVSSVFTRTGAVVAVAGDYTASEIANVPSGGIAAVEMQAAIDELDTEKEPILGNPASDGDVLSSTIAGARYWAAPSGGGGGGVNPNITINGNFDLWEDGTIWTSAASGQYVADLFKFARVCAAVTDVSRSTDVPTTAESGLKSTYSLLHTITTAQATVATGDYIVEQYAVEGFDYKQLDGNSGTMSFWVKSSKTGAYCVSFRNSGGNRSYISEYTINTANTWEKKTITVLFNAVGGTWDYATGVGLRVAFALLTGTTYQTTANSWQTGNFFSTANQVNWADTVGATFQIAQVKLEKGTSATAFVPRSYGEELALEQRYFHISGFGSSGWRHNSTAVALSFVFDVVMRVIPTISVANAAPTIYSYADGYRAATGMTNSNISTGTAGTSQLLGGFAAGTIGAPVILLTNALKFDARL